jgi:hypothetical protein
MLKLLRKTEDLDIFVEKKQNCNGLEYQNSSII